MESRIKTKKKNSHKRLRNFPTLGFKKFQMKLDDLGVHIIISANFLKKGNHSVRVENGVLHLKVLFPEGFYDYGRRTMSLEGYKKDMDFHIRLPDKLHRHINSVKYHNGTLKIHLTDQRKAGGVMKFPELSEISNQVAVSRLY